MKWRCLLVAALCIAATCEELSAQTPLGSEFTYQGQLRAQGLPSISTADFQFSLFDVATGGSQLGSTVAKSNVGMGEGAFTVSLDFGAAAFQGNARWLEVSVRSPAGAGGFTTLAPRQLLAATPNATYASQTRGITVDAAGQVGVGTATPARRLTVAGDMELGTGNGEYRNLRVRASSTAGFLFSAFHEINDGIHLAFNEFIDSNGVSHLVNTGGGATRVSLDYDSIVLAVSDGVGSAPENRLIVDRHGTTFLSPVGVGGPPSSANFNIDGSMLIDMEDANDNFFVHDGNHNPIWGLGISTFDQPIFSLISPVTGDLEAGFYRDPDTGNGVMFADDKNFRVPNPADASTDIWYCCPEGPEAAMYVRGTARLTYGRAMIELPEHFRNLGSEPGMTVQLTPRSPESEGLSTSKVSLMAIEVVELHRGTGNYEFDWRVEAVRKGWEDYKVIRPWLQSDKDPDKSWQNRLKWIDERRAQRKPAPPAEMIPDTRPN